MFSLRIALISAALAAVGCMESHTTEVTGAGGDSSTGESPSRQPYDEEPVVGGAGGASSMAPTECELQPVPVCTPGQSIACACDDGAEGGQTCNTDGEFDACVCEASRPVFTSGRNLCLGYAAGAPGTPCYTSNPILYVNFEAPPPARFGGCTPPLGDFASVPGAYCCNTSKCVD